MRFKNYLKFIHSYCWRENKFQTLVDCAYQKDQKAFANLGSYEDLCQLIKRLNEMREFYNERIKDK